MYFPGEPRVLHFTEQSRFTVHEHDYKHGNKIHTSEKKTGSGFFFFSSLHLLSHVL